MPSDESKDWPAIVQRLIDGDHLAFLEMSRLVTGFLSHWRAFDFRSDWDDVIQEVVISTVEAVRNNRLDNPKAIPGYVKTATKYKFVDRIRARQRVDADRDAEEAADELQWPPYQTASSADSRELWDIVERLPDPLPEVVMQIYVQGRTYEEASQASGIPLGSLKRYLRQALEALGTQMVKKVV